MFDDILITWPEKFADFFAMLPTLFPFVIMAVVGRMLYRGHRTIKRLKTQSYETSGHLLERGKPMQIKNSKTNKVSYRYKVSLRFNGESHTFRVAIPETLKESFEALSLTESLLVRFDPKNSKQFYLPAWDIYRIDFKIWAYAFYLSPVTQELLGKFQQRPR